MNPRVTLPSHLKKATINKDTIITSKKEQKQTIAQVSKAFQKQEKEHKAEVKRLQGILLTRDDTTCLINAMQSDYDRSGIAVALQKLGKQEEYLKDRGD